MILPEEDSFAYLVYSTFEEVEQAEKKDQEARDRAYQDEMRRG